MRNVSAFERHAAAVPLEDTGVVAHTVVEGETLSLIAHRHYGDWRLGTAIAEYNSVADMRRVAPGTILLIPPRPLEQGAFESA